MANYNFVDQENLKTVVDAIKSKYTTKKTTSELSDRIESESQRADKIEDTIEEGIGVMDVLVDGNSIMQDKKVHLTLATDRDINSLFE